MPRLLTDPGLVFPFEHPHATPPRELSEVLGGKGANLAEMTSVLGLPVPAGFTLTTAASELHRDHGWFDGFDEAIDAAIAALERKMGRNFGDSSDPLLLSVRSGAPSSMPGMLDTVLNLGLTTQTVKGLAASVGDRCALDSFRRLIVMYASVVLGLPVGSFEQVQALHLREHECATFDELDSDALEALCLDLVTMVEDSSGCSFPDPTEQLRAAIEAVFRSWDGSRARTYRRHEGIPEGLGTAVNIQAMVFGNRDDRSGTGVAFSRDPATGSPAPYGDFLICAQGEDVVSGAARTRSLRGMADAFPEAYDELMGILERLEAHYQDLCDTEFTIESGRLWMLQTRIGKRTAAAAVRVAVDLATQPGWRIERADALRRVREEDVVKVSEAVRRGVGPTIAVGLPASPGAASGRAYLSADACVDAVDRGEVVILVRSETSPDDIHGMQVASGILTARGGLVSHAAVVARGWGIPAVVGVDALSLFDTTFSIGDATIGEGEYVSIDGATGEVRLGRADTTLEGEVPDELGVLLGWADEVSGLRGEGRSPSERLLAAHAVLGHCGFGAMGDQG